MLENKFSKVSVFPTLFYSNSVSLYERQGHTHTIRIKLQQSSKVCIIKFLWSLTENQWIGCVLFFLEKYISLHLVTFFLYLTQVTFYIDKEH